MVPSESGFRPAGHMEDAGGILVAILRGLKRTSTFFRCVSLTTIVEIGIRVSARAGPRPRDHL